MVISNKSLERICKIFGYLDGLSKSGVTVVSSSELARAIGATDYTIRKDISLLGMTRYNRKGYDVAGLKKDLGSKLKLSQKRKACIVGLGRLGSALLDYEKFQEDGFEIVAGFDSSVNKIERIRTDIAVFAVSHLKNVIRQRGIELGIITVGPEAAQEIADTLVAAGVKGILNFSPVKIIVPESIIHLDIDFTSALRFIAARFTGNESKPAAGQVSKGVLGGLSH
jgi:redox-sensing transcriptional repressor